MWPSGDRRSERRVVMPVALRYTHRRHESGLQEDEGGGGGAMSRELASAIRRTLGTMDRVSLSSRRGLDGLYSDFRLAGLRMRTAWVGSRVVAWCEFPQELSTLERFLLRVEPEPNSGCWLFTGGIFDSGYGDATTGHSTGEILAHRVSWALVNGPVPADLFVLHSCDVKPCVNPRHLRLGTVNDNAADRVSRNRSYRPIGVLNKQAKLTAESVRAIRASSETRSQLAARFGVSRNNIDCVLGGKSWTHV
jgi:hypothetical protein